MSDHPPIHVEDASLSTVSIEVKVLRIGKKQMTLAVFRQLPKRELIDEAGNIVGLPWGHVNYHQDCPEEEHLHVIWQGGGVLWRNTVFYRSPYLDDLSKRAHQAANIWLLGAALSGWKPSGNWAPDVGAGYGGRIPCELWGMKLTLLPDVDVSYILQPDLLMKHFPVQTVEEQIARSRKTVEGRLAQQAPGLNDIEIEAMAEAAVSAYVTHKRNYEASYERLAALDQLFIAV